MKILIVTGIYPPDIGGPATYTKKLQDTLPKRGWEVHVLTLGEKKSTSSLTYISRKLSFFERNKRIKEFVEKHYFDVVYAQDPFSVGWGVSRAKTSAKKILKVVGDNVWEIAQETLGVTDNIDDFQKNNYGIKIRSMKKIQKKTANNFDQVITPSKYLKKIVGGWGVPENKIKVIYNAVEIKKHTRLQKRTIKKELGLRGKNVVFVGRLVPWKGLSELIEVFKTRKENLIIVGGGPVEDTLRIEAEGVDNVVFTGRVSHEEALKYVYAADALILNSGYEGLPHVVIEAFQLETPALLSRSGGNSEVVQHKKNGYLFTYNNKREIRSALDALTSINARKWVSESQKTVKKFSWIYMINELESVLERKKVVLSISLDKDLFRKGSAVARRLNLYADSFDGEIHAIVHTPIGYENMQQGNVYAYPTNSRTKIFFPLRAYSIGKKVLRKKPVLIQTQDPHATGLSGVWLKKKSGLPLCIHFHADFMDNQYWMQETFLNKILNMLSKRVIRWGDGFRVVSQKIKKSLIRRGIPEKKIFSMSTPIDLEFFFDRSEVDEKKFMRKFGIKKPFILFIGRLTKQKNIPLLLEAFKEFGEKYTLIIAGDGELRKELEKEAKGLDVLFVGNLNQRESRAAYYLCDFVVLPSWYEGTSKVLKEASACGTPCIATAVSGTEEVIDDGKTGYIVSINDKDSLVEAMNYLGDAQKRIFFGRAAKNKMRKEQEMSGVEGITGFWMKIARKEL